MQRKSPSVSGSAGFSYPEPMMRAALGFLLCLAVRIAIVLALILSCLPEPRSRRMDRPLIGAVVAYLIALAIGVALVLLLPWPASAHEWYPYQCCSDKDCASVPFEEVQITPRGYLLRSSGDVIEFGDKRIKPTPPEDNMQRYHVCRVGGLPKGKVLCLFVPESGA